MLLPIVAICVSVACSSAAIFVSLRAISRIAALQLSFKDLDWEAVAKITGDIGSVKRSIQQVNNRINGMESSKGTTASALEQVQQAAAAQSKVRYLGG